MISINSQRIAVVIAVFVIGQSTPTIADDGEFLLNSCRKNLDYFDDKVVSVEHGFDVGWCAGYTASAISTHKTYQPLLEEGVPRSICIPEKVTTIQAIRVIVLFLDNHPELLHESAGALVVLAFQNAFPCKVPDE